MHLRISKYFVALAVLLCRQSISAAPLPASSPELHTLDQRGLFEGDATYYDVGLGSCGQVSGNSDLIVALNAPQAGGSYPPPHCGEKIRITANGRTRLATVADTCGGCKFGDLDMSPALFQYFNDLGVGRFGMAWEFVDGGELPPSSTSTIGLPTSTSTTNTFPSPLPQTSTIPTQAHPSTFTAAIPTFTTSEGQPSSRPATQKSTTALEKGLCPTAFSSLTVTTSSAVSEFHPPGLAPSSLRATSTPTQPGATGKADVDGENGHFDPNVSNLESLSRALVNMARMVIVLSSSVDLI